MGMMMFPPRDTQRLGQDRLRRALTRSTWEWGRRRLGRVQLVVFPGGQDNFFEAFLGHTPLQR